MDAVQRRKHETAGRVKGFCDANPDENEGTKVTVVRLGGLYERAITLSSQQRSGQITEMAAAERRELALDLTQENLRVLQKFGKAGSREIPELAHLFQVPPNGASQEVIMTAARTNLAEAEARKELLLGKGMAPTLLTDLAKGIADVEQATSDFHTGRRAHVGATADLDQVFSDIMDVIRHLDGIYSYRFRDNAEMLAAWKSAKDVVWPVKGETDVPAESGEAEKKAEPAA